MIIEATELTSFAPTVTLTEPALSAAIALAQAQLEGIRGANRKLEQKQYTSIYRLNIGSQTFRIQEFPLADITSLQGRIANVRNRYGNHTSLGDWIDIDTENYNVDLEDRLVTINRGFFQSFYSGFGSNFSSRNNQIYTEVKATYTAGFDFTDNTNTDVLAIKAALAQVLTYQQQSPINSGVSTEKIDDEYSVSYRASSGGSSDRVGAGIGQVPDGMLETMKQYCLQGNVFK